MAKNTNHILMVFTGGTISTRLHKKALELGTAPYALLDSSKRSSHAFDIIEPINALSENITPEMYRVLFSAIDRAFSPKKHCGIMIAHGTDTLAYTAQLANLFFSRYTVPIVFFGSKRPLDDPQSDARKNFKDALSLISKVEKGVYVVSRASNQKTYVHHAGRIQSADVTTDDFSSYGNLYAGRIVRKSFVPNPDFVEPPVCKSASTALSKLKKLRELPIERNVLCIPAYGCASYEYYQVGMPSFSYVLVQPHHSGTANALSEDNPYSILFLKRACDNHGKRVFFGPYSRSKPLYSTSRAIIDAGITPVPDMPFEAAWAILMLCTWLGIDPDRFFKVYKSGI
ncbi:MAG: asparaginase [Clostridiales bacterium]|nr:asparaginase [Clostridiales bacterium]